MTDISFPGLQLIADTAAGHGLPVTMGILTAAIALVIFISCRCIPLASQALQLKVTQHQAYRLFYKYHCYLWWVFWVVLVLHILSGIEHLAATP